MSKKTKVIESNVQPNPKEAEIWAKVNEDGSREIKQYNSSTGKFECCGGSGNGSGSGEGEVSMEYYAATKYISDITEIQSLLSVSSHSAMLFNVDGAPENSLRVHPSALNYHMTESFPQCLVWRIAGTNLPIKDNVADEWIDTGSFASNYETYYGKPLSDSFRPITKEEFFDESYNPSDIQ